MISDATDRSKSQCNAVSGHIQLFIRDKATVNSDGIVVNEKKGHHSSGPSHLNVLLSLALLVGQVAGGGVQLLTLCLQLQNGCLRVTHQR